MGKMIPRFVLFTILIGGLLILDATNADDSVSPTSTTTMPTSTSTSAPTTTTTTKAPTTTTTTTTTTPKPTSQSITSTTTTKATTTSSSQATAYPTASSQAKTQAKTAADAPKTSTTKADSASGTNSSKPDPAFGQELVSGLIKSLVPSAIGNTVIGGAGGGGAGGISNTIGVLQKISDPLTDLITSNGEPNKEDVKKIIKAVPEMAIMASMSNLFGGAKAAQNKNNNVVVVDQQGAVLPSNFSEWTPQQIDDLMAGKIALPSMNSLPSEYVNTVLSGGALPGLTLEQTTTLKDRYMAQMFNPTGGSSGGSSGGGGLDALFGSLTGSSSSNQSMTNQSWINQVNGTHSNQSSSATSSPSSSIFAGVAFDELRKLDLTKLSSSVIQDFMRGEIPDLGRIPQDFLTDLIYKTPQLFANIVSSELHKKMQNRSSTNGDEYDQSHGAGKSIPYDVNSLDRKADISMYKQDEDDQRATLITAIVLGVVGLLTIVLIAALCWRRHRKQRLARGEPMIDEVVTPSSSAVIERRVASGADLIVVNEDEESSSGNNRFSGRSIGSNGSSSDHDQYSNGGKDDHHRFVGSSSVPSSHHHHATSVPFGRSSINSSSRGSLVSRQDPPRIVIQEI